MSDPSAAALHAATPDGRVFRRHGEGWVHCAPADFGAADAHLRNLGIRRQGPTEGWIGPRGLTFYTGSPFLAVCVWHVPACDIDRLDNAGLIDHDRAADYSV